MRAVISPVIVLVTWLLFYLLSLWYAMIKCALKRGHVFCVTVMLSQSSITPSYTPYVLINTYDDEILSWDEIGCPPLVYMVLISL